MFKNALFLTLFVLTSASQAQETAASCPSAKALPPTLGFSTQAPASNTMLKAPVSVLGNGSSTWIRYAKDAPWAVPFVRLQNGKDLFLSWTDDGECMRVALNGQDFQLGYKGEEAHVLRD